MPTTIDGSTGVSQVQAGSIQTDDLAAGAVTPPKLSGGQSGNPPVFGARAWCVFNGTLAGTNAPIAGGNVSSVTRNAAGDYTVNFATAMPDGDYSVSGSARGQSDVDTNSTLFGSGVGTNSAARVFTKNAANTLVDSSRISVAIFR